MIKAVIFDSDGTLFYSQGLGEKSLHKTCQVWNEPCDIAKYHALNGLTRKDKLKALFPKKYKKMWPLWNRLYTSEYSSAAKVFPGVIKEIKRLHKENTLLFVYSTKYAYLVKQALRKYHLRSYFEKIIGGEYTPRKPHKKAIQAIMKKYRLEKNEIVIVGDTFIDEQTAKNAKIKFIFVQYKKKNTDVRQYYKRINSLSKLNIALKKLE